MLEARHAQSDGNARPVARMEMQTMTTDLVERLRLTALMSEDGALMREAADEIERLTAAYTDARDLARAALKIQPDHNIHTTSATTVVDELQAEIERLRGEIEQYRERLGLR